MNRFDYVRYDDEAAIAQAQFKEIFIEVNRYIDVLYDGRAKELALTKLEEAYMWVGKAIRDEQISRNVDTELQEERRDS